MQNDMWDASVAAGPFSSGTETMTRSNRTDFFREATLHLCGTLDIEKALYKFVKYASDFLPIDQITLNILESETNSIRVVASANAGMGQKLDRLAPLPATVVQALKGSGLPKVRTVNRPETDRVTLEMARVMGHPDSSFIIMRLELDRRRLGAAVVRCNGKNRYGRNHETYIEDLNGPFAIALSNYLRYREVLRLRDLLADDNRFLHDEIKSLTAEEIIGRDHGLKHVMELVGQVAPLDSPVLLLGETGTGKEVIANALHDASRRRNAPLVKVNCAAIPDTLMDSELFGHEKGAFTGATAQKRGRFERAHGGTLFLDEIAELKPEAQAKLLRVLQHREIDRVGGTQTIPVDVRIIAATHRNLEQMTNRQEFREDLWYRLNVFPIFIPPLRARKGDIAPIAGYFIEKKTAELGIASPPPLSSTAMDQLRAYHWPGNVRELENVIERALITGRGAPLAFDELDVDAPGPPPPMMEERKETPVSFEEASRRLIAQTLALTNGRIEGDRGAAKRLKLNPSTLRNKMKKLGIRFKAKKTRPPKPS